jgi:tol-pal system protein YbgF
MTRHLFGALLCLTTLALPATAAAQNREQLQTNAELRMLQEQISKLQITTNQLVDSIRAINKRFDDQAVGAQKTFADMQNLIKQQGDLIETIRGKLDDNTVRVQELKQELPALRSGLSMVADTLNNLVSLLQPPVNPVNADGSAPSAAVPSGQTPVPGSAGLGSVRVPDSPNALFDNAMQDYMSNHLDNAVQGFDEFLQKYPTAPKAAEAQYRIGMAYYLQGKYKDALAALGKVVANYKNAGEVVQDAYFQQGLCYLELNQKTEARQLFQRLIQMYPGTTDALLADQKLKNMGPAR